MEIGPASNTAMQHASLDAVRAGGRRRYWEELVNAIHPESSASFVDEAQFYGKLSWRHMGDLLLCDIRSAPQRVRRQSAHIRRDDRDVIQLNVQLEGIGNLVQDGRTCATHPGEIVIYDSSRPYELLFEKPFRHLYIEFPRELLLSRYGFTEYVTARSIEGTTGMGRFLFGYASALVLQSGDGDVISGNRLQNHLVELLITAISGLPIASAVPAKINRTQTLCRAKTYIADNLADETLSPAKVAEALGVSRRYLYDLFADEGMAVGNWIRQSRLERCRCDIEDMALSARSLSDIAFSWGFNDAAHFSRAFRNHFGISPKGFRTARRDSTSSPSIGARLDNF